MPVLTGLAAALAAILGLGLFLQMLQESGDANSYAQLANAFLHGRLDVTQCIDADCAFYDGRIYNVFPPVPALLAMPFVLIFGPGFAGFTGLAVILSGLSAALWWRIFKLLDVEQGTAGWLLLALLFATPLYFVTIRADGVWFFAQAVGFFLITAAIHEALRGADLVRVGVLVALAFLSRQMLLFYAPFLFALALRQDAPLLSLRAGHVAKALKVGLPIAAGVLVYMVYNEVRFGSPLDTGYAYISADQPGEGTFITHRIHEIGLFSPDYLLFNMMHLFVQGFHAEFSGRYMTELVALDPMGTSLLAASPFVLFAFFTPLRRPVVIGLLTIALIAGLTLFYHSNGFSQYNVQRYTLDWLPILFYMLALALTREMRPILALLVTYAIGLNAVAMVVLAYTQVA